MATLVQPNITATDRLGLTLFLAVVLHGIVILGISFSQEIHKREHQQRPLDIVLVHTQSLEAPEDAKHIAQFNQEASGSSDTPDRPTSPTSTLVPSFSAGDASLPRESQQSHIQLTSSQQLLHTQDAERQIASDEQTEQEQQLTEEERQLIERRDLEIARLAAELQIKERHYAERPKIHFIDALSAKSSVEAKYVDDWVHRVEDIGNLNYPDEAKRDSISGKLILNVLLDNQGEVIRVQVAISSGSKVLDEAAVQIVKISSPFPAFPPEMRSAYDQLMITRTWVFHTEGT